MPKVARKGDPVITGHLCTTETILDSPSQGGVYAGNKLICRLGDETISHTVLVGTVCVPHVTKINKSSGTVYVKGSLIARVGDTTGCGATSKISSASPSVFNTK